MWSKLLLRIYSRLFGWNWEYQRFDSHEFIVHRSVHFAMSVPRIPPLDAVRCVHAVGEWEMATTTAKHSSILSIDPNHANVCDNWSWSNHYHQFCSPSKHWEAGAVWNAFVSSCWNQRTMTAFVCVRALVCVRVCSTERYDSLMWLRWPTHYLLIFLKVGWIRYP